MTDYIDRALAPLVEQLRARYPGVRIVSASLCERPADGELQQEIRYQAPLERLKALGLLTSCMIARDRAWPPADAIGDGFHLCASLDRESRPGQWDLLILTGASPRERARFSVLPARRLLRRILRESQT